MAARQRLVFVLIGAMLASLGTYECIYGPISRLSMKRFSYPSLAVVELIAGIALLTAGVLSMKKNRRDS